MCKKLHYQALKNQCEICNANNKIVFGEGNLDSKIVLIGEAPGETEVEKGHCFVGKAGKNLSDFLDILELKREDIYITNSVKFRPTDISKHNNIINRTPTEDEVIWHRYYLEKEISIIKPKLIVTLGATALKSILNNFKVGISKKHGTLIKRDICIFPLYHPASIIYNEKLKTDYLKDLDTLKEYIKTLQ